MKRWIDAANNMVISKLKNAVHFLKKGIKEGDVAGGVKRAQDTIQQFASKWSVWMSERC